ncbi:lariat debranching enzyme, C-terminal domain-containing protein [Mycotypha africana]|uniref:lariat debranching enzyme, C-terminal domain-containing protein n=1 Tax=Mycotypha africana TaxID=64632 RepID=UPI002300C31A|nr:lariat debranching enzyme, C-terminal domain-containing protein [Mycotypha africana]KAI8967707.1 lariat debranching enzyme, C-terminal domain-containing protein [Mycotypha africana]
MKVAIEGCCHGELDDIYGSIRLIEQRDNIKIDLVLICGDFQSVRNEADAICMSVPAKYRQLGTFWKYYSGREKAPYPTVFIGGNHEASNYLWELYHGGWVCDNIYYMGYANVIRFGGLRIGGLSGIYKSYHYDKGHYETSPYSEDHKKSAYHYRKYDVEKLLHVQEPLDIFMSHDWPRGIERYGNLKKLMREKKFFINEIMSNSLGSEPNFQLLAKLKPSYWFSAHLHVHYAALVDHSMLEKGEYPEGIQALLKGKYPPSASASTPRVKNEDEIVIDVRLDIDSEAKPEETSNESTADDDNSNGSTNRNVNTSSASTYEGGIQIEQNKDADAVNDGQSMASVSLNTSISPKYTKFLSLDKCLPGRKFLQILDIPSPNDDNQDYDFYYDMEWLAITRALHPFLSTTYQQAHIPFTDDELQNRIAEERRFLETKQQSGILDLKIPHNFEPTAPAYNPEMLPTNPQLIKECQHPFLNPQTAKFCEEIGIENKINSGCRQTLQLSEHENSAPITDMRSTYPETSTVEQSSNHNSRCIDTTESFEVPSTKRTKIEERDVVAAARNPSEIMMDDEEFM